MALLKACQSGKRQIHQLFGWSSFHFVTSLAQPCIAKQEQISIIAKLKFFSFPLLTFGEKDEPFHFPADLVCAAVHYVCYPNLFTEIMVL
jgi:hypothetical protein